MPPPSRVQTADGLRVDRVDFDHVVDAPFRLQRDFVGAILDAEVETAVLHSNAEVQKGRALVFHGFTVSRIDAQHIAVSPGRAICRLATAAGYEWGQITGGSGDKTIVMGGAQEARGVWVKAKVSPTDNARRVRWDQEGETEEFFALETRSVDDFEVALGVDATTPPATTTAAWFKVAQVDYTGGSVGVDDVADHRQLFFEGDARYGFVVPAFNRNDERGSIGLRTFYDFAVAVLTRLGELGGRKWYETPYMGENVRSASTAITVEVSDGAVGGAHLQIATAGIAPSVLEGLIEDPSSASASDGRTELRFLPLPDLTRPQVIVNTGTGSPAPTNVTHRTITGPVIITRSAGANASLALGGPITLRHVAFTTLSAGNELVRVAVGAGVAVFEDCTFDTVDFGAECVQIMSGAQVIFRRCSFASELGDTNLVRVNADNGLYVFENCTFTGGGKAVAVVKLPGAVVIRECVFTGQGEDAISADADYNVAVISSVFDTQAANPIAIAEADDVPGVVLDGTGDVGTTENPNLGLVSTGPVIAGTLRASRGVLVLDDQPGDEAMKLTAEVGSGTGNQIVTTARGGGPMALRAGVIHSDDAGRIVLGGVQGGALGVGAALQYRDSNGVERLSAETFTSFGSSTVDLALAADVLRLGRDITNARGQLHRNIIPRGWVTIKMVNGSSAIVLGTSVFQSWFDKTTRTIATDHAVDAHRFRIGRVDGNGTALGFDFHVTASIAALTSGPALDDDEQLAVSIRDLNHEGFIVVPQKIDATGAITTPGGDDWNGDDDIPDYEITIQIVGRASTTQFVDGGGDTYT